MFVAVRAFLISAALIASAVPKPAIASDSLTQTNDLPLIALDADAANYAEYFHVPVAEAKERLELQRLAGPLDETLAEKYPETFAGLWITNAPNFAVNVAFTSSGQSELGGLVDDRLATYMRIHQAEWSLRDLLSSMAAFVGVADRAFDMEIDVAQNRVALLTTDAVALSKDLRSQLSLDLDPIVIREVPALSVPTANIYGGLPISGCTSGFAIINNGIGDKGIVTAGHCPNTQTYSGVNLPFKSQVTAGAYDEQWNGRNTFTAINRIRWQPDQQTRDITAKKIRSNMVVGETVCKYGSTTFYTCAEIVSKNYQPTSCISGATGSYVYVHRNGVGMADLGDSGGPVFFANVAYGIVNCKAQYQSSPPLADLIFMTSDAIEFGLGITIMTAP